MNSNRIISMMKVTVSVIICCLLFIVTTGHLQADDIINAMVSKNDDTGFAAVIQDKADLLTDSEELELMTKMQDVTEYSTAIFVTSTDSHSGTLVNYARYVLEDICGQLNLDGYTAVIFLIDMYSRELIIYSGETVFKTITTGIADSITDNTYTYASRGDYLGCAKEAFSQIYKVMDGQKIAQPMRYITAALLAIFVGLAVSLILVRRKTKREEAGHREIINALTVNRFEPTVNSRLINSRRIKHVEVTVGDGGHGGGFGGGGHSGGFGGGGGFSGGGGGGGFSGGGGGGFSGGGGGGSHRF